MGHSLNKALKAFQQPNERLSNYYILSTALLGFSSIFLAVACFNSFPVITFLLYPLVFIMMCRSFVLLHDAGHNTLYKERWKNAVAGNIMGFINLIPKELFGFMHGMHHATVGNLDKRDHNPELKTLTTEEYAKSTPLQKLRYRFMRSAFARLILTPLALFIVVRFPLPMLKAKGKVSAIGYDLLIAGVLFLAVKYEFLTSLLVGFFIPLFACYVLVAIVFYLQHQFEDTHWLEEENWSLTEASLDGSSFLIFGKFMKAVTCNIGYHHIHHLNPLIPCYNLADAHDHVKQDITYKEVKISELFRHMRGKLWDKEAQKLVHFSEVK